MYISKYYNTEEIDERLLQGYYNDFVEAGYSGSKADFFKFVLSLSQKVDKVEGKDLSTNDFTNELKQKLENIDAGAKLITKVSQLENDSKYQTEADVKTTIDKLVGGASDALDTLKELEDALAGDPNFAATITNKINEIKTSISTETDRAKEAEKNLTDTLNTLNSSIDNNKVEAASNLQNAKKELQTSIDSVKEQADTNKTEITNLKTVEATNLATTKEYARNLVDQEKARATEQEKTNADNISALEKTHITDNGILENTINSNKIEVDNKIGNLTTSLATKEEALKTSQATLQNDLNKEIQDRKDANTQLEKNLNSTISTNTSTLNTKIDKEIQDRTNDTTLLSSRIQNEVTDRTNQDALLDHKIEDNTTLIKQNQETISEKLNQEIKDRTSADTNLSNTKVDKVEGKGLSTNDFSDDLKKKLEGIDAGAKLITKVSQLINDEGYQTSKDVEAAIAKVINNAPDTLNTLQELAKALGDDPNFATTLTNMITQLTAQFNQEKADRVAGDDQVQANLDAEVTRAKDKEADLQKDIDKEATARKEANTSLQTSLADTKTSLQNTDAEIKQSITDLKASVKSNDDSLTEKLSNEVTRAQTAEKDLSDKINAANTLHTNDVSNINAKITQEIQDRSTAVSAILEVKELYVKDISDLQFEQSNQKDMINTNIGNIQSNLNMIQTLQANLKAANEENASLKKEVASLTTQIQSLESKHSNDIANLQAQIEAFKEATAEQIDDLKVGG